MDRNEAMLRELHLHPQWKRRNLPEPVISEPAAPESVVPEPVVEVQVLTQQAQPPEAPVVSPASPVQTQSAPPQSAQQDAEIPQDAEKNDTPLPQAEDKPSKLAKLNWPELKQQVHDCAECKLRADCTQTVFGVGDEQADWLFVGEGPGADEDALGEPFVGQAGKLLDNMLMSIKLKRGQNAYIANVVKCRPPNNRNPDSSEIATCMPYLQRQIQLIQPKLIIALGKVASNTLLGKDATLASLRGKLHDYNGIPMIVTYHPAYLLRSPSEKAKAWADLCLAIKTFG